MAKKVSNGVAAVAGALFGAAASASAIFLSKQENRQKVKREVKSLENRGKKAVRKIKALRRKVS